MEASSRAMSAAARTRWLSELSIAIDEAQWLAWRIGVVEGDNPEALELYVRLEIARAEVEALRGRDLQLLRQVSESRLLSASDPLGELAASGEGLEE